MSANGDKAAEKPAFRNPLRLEKLYSLGSIFRVN